MSQWIFDADEATFEQAVIDRSRSIPVLVDFWAAWCGPCRTLGPMLQDAVNKRNGQILLAKVDVDKNQNLAAAFGIRGIPAVKAFINGRPAGEFVGVRDEHAIHLFIDSLIPSPEEQIIASAKTLIEQNSCSEAIERLTPLLDAPHHRDTALVLTASAHMKCGDLNQAKTTLDLVDERSALESEVNALRIRLELIEAAGQSDEKVLQNAVAQSPKDPSTHWALAGRLVANNKIPAALEALLQVVQLDRKYRDDGGRRAMLALFDVLGPDHDTAHEFRRKLQIYV